MFNNKSPENFVYQIEALAEDKPDFKVMTFENGDYPDEVLSYGDITINARPTRTG